MNREKEPALCACIAVLSAKARRCLASAIEHMLFSPRGGPSLDTLENAAPEEPHKPTLAVTTTEGTAIRRMSYHLPRPPLNPPPLLPPPLSYQAAPWPLPKPPKPGRPRISDELQAADPDAILALRKLALHLARRVANRTPRNQRPSSV